MMTMQWIVSIIVKTQASGGKWLIYEAVVYNVRLYLYLYGDELDDFLKV